MVCRGAGSGGGKLWSTVILARRSGESVTTPFISDPIQVGPQQQLSLTYWMINQSHENHDPKAQQERFDKTIQAFRDGVSIAGLITSALLTPAGLVPGAIAASVTGAVTTALTVTQVLFDALSGGPDVNCDGFVFIGAWSATLDDLVARTATPDAHTTISIRYADLEQSPSACGAAPDTDVVLSLRNLGPVSFDPALTGPRTVRPDVAPVDLSLIGYWGDAPLVDQCRFCATSPPSLTNPSSADRARWPVPRPPSVGSAAPRRVFPVSARTLPGVASADMPAPTPTR